MSDEEDRTSDPSPRRIQMAREMGFLPIAFILVQATGLIVSIGLVYMRGPALAHGLHLAITETWAKLPELARGQTTPRAVRAMVFETIYPLIEPLLSITLGTIAIMAGVHQITTGGSWTPTLAMPNFGRIWKLSIFSEEGSASRKPPMSHRLLLGVLRPLAVCAGCFMVIMLLRSRWAAPQADEGTQATLRSLVMHGRVSIGMGLTMLTIPLIFLGAVEYLLARVHWIDQLRPSSDQARREMRESEGDGEWKRKRQKLVRRIRQTSTIEALVAETAVVVVGTGFSGLSVQLVRSGAGRLAVGQVVRGTIAAAYAEKAASQGKPWLRDGKLAARLAGLAGKPNQPPAELPAVLDLEIQRRITRDRQSK